nr:GNAT family N-acetyltransferase [Idiomarina xiamenensis]
MLGPSEQMTASLNRYRDYLGHEYAWLVIDCREQLHADAIAACCGTLQAGGLLVLLLPEQPSPFALRLLDHAACFAEIQQQPANESTWHAIGEACQQLSRVTPNNVAPEALKQQQQIVEQLLGSQSPQLLIADRGRGKSATLGLAAKQWLASHHGELLITAPHPSAIAQVKRYVGANHERLRFRPWDKLLQQSPAANSPLIIDEAAAIPLPQLRRLCQHYQPLWLATTVAGYEGCGRGFVVHFEQWLRQRYPQLGYCQLQQPLRWAADDPLERWLWSALLLQQPSATATSSGIDERYHDCHASELDDSLLAQAFDLLLQGHYQSSPNDLKLLLDDPQQRLLLASENGQITGVVWYSQEGPLSAELAVAVQRGQRRPAGNLIPQAVGYYLQQQWALRHRCWRIVRIVVTTAQRRQGLGSQLLQQLRQQAQQQRIDWLATSYGYTQPLSRFWLNNHYQTIRISQRLDKSSGRPACFAAQALSTELQPPLATLVTYQQQQQRWREQQLSTTDVAQFAPPLLDIIDALYDAFINAYIGFNDAQFALFCQHQRGLICLPQTLHRAIDEAQLAQRLQQPSRASALAYLRQHLNLLKN